MISQNLYGVHSRVRVVLDLGCGYGIVGILAGKIINQNKIYMVDNDPEAIKYAKINSKKNNIENINITFSDGFYHLNEKDYNLIISNPPYHLDFSVAKHFIEKGFNRLIQIQPLIITININKVIK